MAYKGRKSKGRGSLFLETKAQENVSHWQAKMGVRAIIKIWKEALRNGKSIETPVGTIQVITVKQNRRVYKDPLGRIHIVNYPRNPRRIIWKSKKGLEL